MKDITKLRKAIEGQVNYYISLAKLSGETPLKEIDPDNIIRLITSINEFDNRLAKVLLTILNREVERLTSTIPVHLSLDNIAELVYHENIINDYINDK